MLRNPTVKGFPCYSVLSHTFSYHKLMGTLMSMIAGMILILVRMCSPPHPLRLYTRHAIFARYGVLFFCLKGGRQIYNSSTLSLKSYQRLLAISKTNLTQKVYRVIFAKQLIISLLCGILLARQVITMILRPQYVEKVTAYVDTPFVKILSGVRRSGSQLS